MSTLEFLTAIIGLISGLISSWLMIGKLFKRLSKR